MVLALSPLMVWLWLVTKVLSRVVTVPYPVVGPYSTWLEAGLLVVQLIWAPVPVMLLAATALIASGGGGGGGPLPTSVDQPAPPNRVALSGLAVASAAMVPAPSSNFQLPTSPAGADPNSLW